MMMVYLEQASVSSAILLLYALSSLFTVWLVRLALIVRHTRLDVLSQRWYMSHLSESTMEGHTGLLKLLLLGSGLTYFVLSAVLTECDVLKNQDHLIIFGHEGNFSHDLCTLLEAPLYVWIDKGWTHVNNKTQKPYFSIRTVKIKNTNTNLLTYNNNFFSTSDLKPLEVMFRQNGNYKSLKLHFKTPGFYFLSSVERDISPGQGLTLLCASSDHPPTDLTIVKQGQHQHLTTSIFYNSLKFVIKIFSCEDTGIYLCYINQTNYTSKSVTVASRQCPPRPCSEDFTNLKIVTQIGSSANVTVCVINYHGLTHFIKINGTLVEFFSKKHPIRNVYLTQKKLNNSSDIVTLQFLNVTQADIKTYVVEILSKQHKKYTFAFQLIEDSETTVTKSIHQPPAYSDTTHTSTQQTHTTSGSNCHLADVIKCPDGWEPADHNMCFTMERVRSSKEFSNLRERCVRLGGSLLNVSWTETLRTIVKCKGSQLVKEGKRVLLIKEEQQCDVINFWNFKQRNVSCYKEHLEYFSVCLLYITKDIETKRVTNLITTSTMPTVTTKTTQRPQPSTTSLVPVKTYPSLQTSPETVVSDKQTSTPFNAAITTTETSPIVAGKETSTSYYAAITTTKKLPIIADKQTSTSFNAAIRTTEKSDESKNSSVSCPRNDDTSCPDNWEPLDVSSCYTIENVKSSTEFFNVKDRCILSGGSLINLEALETLKKIAMCKQEKKERTQALILDDNQLCDVVNLDTFQQHKVTCYKNSVTFLAICTMNVTKNRIASIGQSKDKISTSENVSIKVGIGVGVPVLVIIVLAVLIYINRETLIHLPRPRNRELNPERSRHYINVQLCAVPPIHQITRNEVWGQYDEVEGEYENLKTPGRYLSDQGLVYLTLAQVRPSSLPNHVTPVTRYEPVEYAALDFNLTGAMASDSDDTRVYENGGPADQDHDPPCLRNEKRLSQPTNI